MNSQKRLTRILTVVAGASLLALAGPAAVADDDPSVSPSPTSAYSGNGSAGDNCVVVVQPERTLKNGKVIPAKTRVSDACVQERDRVRDQLQIQKEERAQLRDEVRAAGGSWGVVVRQETMIKVATKLALRHEQAPESASLSRILELINYGLPEQLQFDIQAFCDQYDLIFADLVATDDEVDDSVE